MPLQDVLSATIAVGILVLSGVTVCGVVVIWNVLTKK